MPSLKLINSCLSKKGQRISINDVYSSQSEIPFGVPQGSILDPLLFNILCSYPKMVLLITLMIIPIFLIQNKPQTFFQNAFVKKANPEKYHVLLSKTYDTQSIVSIASSSCEKLLELKQSKSFPLNHMLSLFVKKASQKLNALSQVVSSLKFEQRKLLLNSFFTSQFFYVLVICMFYSRKLNNRINHIHERVLRLVYKDYTSSFDELLLLKI